MNKIKIGSESNIDLSLDKSLYVKENKTININVLDKTYLFIFIDNAKCNINFNINYDCDINIFSVNSSVDVKIDLNKKGINVNYYYSTINEKNNKYLVNINHNMKGTTSKIINHGINLTNKKLRFVINTNVFKKSCDVNCSQDSKIILMGDNNCSIKPNMIIDNNDINATHSAYIGSFKNEYMFYLNSRGINNKNANMILSKAFLINDKIKEEDINKIIEKFDEYWR